MRRRHHNEEDDSLNLHGWPKFFHNLAMFILYPLRKPIKFLMLAAVAFGIWCSPMYFQGLEFDELSGWYKEKISSAIDRYWPKFEKKEKSFKQMRKNRMKKTGIKGNKAIENYAKRYNGEERKKKIKSYSGDEIDKEYQFSLEEYENPAIRNTGRKNPYYGSASQFSLSFPEQILEVRGEATVRNANELSVAGVEMFLFGIYTSPDSSNYKYAKSFLEEQVKGQELRCEIMAYSEQQIATAICYIGAKNINETMVNAHYAKRVM